jgi:hypothetical protein
MSAEDSSSQPAKVGEPQVVELDSDSDEDQPGPTQQVPGDLQVRLNQFFYRFAKEYCFKLL